MQNTLPNETLQAWAEIVIKNWEEKIEKLGISDTGALVSSLVHELYLESSGDAATIAFAFNYYGRFVDMGVGKGVPIGEVKASRNEHTRRPKKWHSKVFFAEVQKLGEIWAEKTGQKAALAITENIESA